MLSYLVIAALVALVVWGLAFTLTKPLQTLDSYAGMPAFAGPTAGRNIQVKRGPDGTEVLIAAVRAKTLTVNGEPIDVTNDDDAAWRKLLQEPGEVSASISVSGVAKNNTLLQEAISTTDRQASTIFLFPGGDKLAGQFNITSYKNTGEYKGQALFEAEFQSAGVLTFTAGA